MPSPTFQAVSVKNLAGVAKGSGNPYSMLIVAGIFTSEEGVVELGEITFMLGRDRASFPVVTPGHKYSPVIVAQARQGKLEFKIDDLRPIVSAAKAA